MGSCDQGGGSPIGQGFLFLRESCVRTIDPNVLGDSLDPEIASLWFTEVTQGNATICATTSIGGVEQWGSPQFVEKRGDA